MPVCHYSHTALGRPSGQCHMEYVGTPVPLILPCTMAQVKDVCTAVSSIMHSIPSYTHILAIATHDH